jgi:hypothetical protein
MRLKKLGKLKEFIDLIVTRAPYLPAYSIAAQPHMIPRAPWIPDSESKIVRLFLSGYFRYDLKGSKKDSYVFLRTHRWF